MVQLVTLPITAKFFITNQKRQKGSPKDPGATNLNEDNIRSPIWGMLILVNPSYLIVFEVPSLKKVQLRGVLDQYIGAPYFTDNNLHERTKKVKADVKLWHQGPWFVGH